MIICGVTPVDGMVLNLTLGSDGNKQEWHARMDAIGNSLMKRFARSVLMGPRSAFRC